MTILFLSLNPRMSIGENRCDMGLSQTSYLITPRRQLAIAAGAARRPGGGRDGRGSRDGRGGAGIPPGVSAERYHQILMIVGADVLRF